MKCHAPVSARSTLFGACGGSDRAKRLLNGGGGQHGFAAEQRISGRIEDLFLCGGDRLVGVVAESEPAQDPHGVDVGEGDEVRRLALCPIAENADQRDGAYLEPVPARAGEKQRLSDPGPESVGAGIAVRHVLRDHEPFLARLEKAAFDGVGVVKELIIGGRIDPEEKRETLLVGVFGRRHRKARHLAREAGDLLFAGQFFGDLVVEGKVGNALLPVDGSNAEEAHRLVGLGRDENVAGVVGREGVFDASCGRVHEGFAHDEDGDAHGEEDADDEALCLVFQKIPQSDAQEHWHESSSRMRICRLPSRPICR